MKSRVAHILGGVVVIVGTVLAGTTGVASASSGRDQTLVESDQLIGVAAPFTGPSNPIRGINGGGAPWVIADGEIELKASGKLEMSVEGLVIDPAFPNAAVAGINPVPFFRIVVSCISKDAAGAATTVNVATGQIPADRAGNSEFEGMVTLPSPCMEPIVFVVNGVPPTGGAWFARTAG
jgi:hypothetical protein